MCQSKAFSTHEKQCSACSGMQASGRMHARIVDKKGRDELALTIDDARKAKHSEYAVDDCKVEPAQAGRAAKRSRALRCWMQQRICAWLHCERMVCVRLGHSHKIERCPERANAKGTVVCEPDYIGQTWESRQHASAPLTCNTAFTLRTFACALLLRVVDAYAHATIRDVLAASQSTRQPHDIQLAHRP